MPKVDGLMCHCTQYKAAERTVVGLICKSQCSEIIPLRDSLLAGVKCLPAHQIRKFCGGTEHRTPVGIRAERAPQVARNVSSQVSHHRKPGMSATEPFVRLRESGDHVPHGINLAGADTRPAGPARPPTPLGDLRPIAQRHSKGCERVQRRLRQVAPLQVRPPNHDKIGYRVMVPIKIG